VAVLSAAAIGFGTAGAQTDDSTDEAAGDAPVVVHSGVVSAGPFGSGDMTEFDECLAGALPDDGFSMEELPVEPSAEDIEALDAEFNAALEKCESLLSDDERAEMARWDDFEACLDEALGGEVKTFEGIDPGEKPDAAIFDELDAQFEAAEAGCRDQLPNDLQAEMDAWNDFDGCLEAQFEGLGPMVTVDGEDGLTIGSFGDEAGTISVTKAADGSLSVDATGSATVSDDPAGEEEWFLPGEAECEPLAPEDADA
jgi:hypothetical protein